MDEYWWVGLIPFYNYYVLSNILFKKGWLFILLFIPGVNIIYMLVIYYMLGEAFGKRDHTTVMHAYKKIEQDIKQNSESNTKLIVDSVKKIILSKE